MELIKQTKEPGRLFINKLSAAERQLASAIRMYFMEEDALAVHTVASAALNLFADLLKLRGKDPAHHWVVYGLFRAAKDYISGDLAIEDLKTWGDGALGILQPAIDILNANPDLDLETLRTSGSEELSRKFWAGKRASYNFLKHADRDFDRLLDDASINNEDIILYAISCLLALNCNLDSEKEIFISFLYARGFLNDPPTEPILIWVLMAHSREEIFHLARKNLCYSRVNDEFEIDALEASKLSKQRLNDHLREMDRKAVKRKQDVKPG